MGKKKRQSDPRENCDDSSTGSCDEKQINNNHGQFGCQHIRKAVDPTKIRKQLKITGVQTDICSECHKTSPIINIECEQLEYEKTVWLCLKCGSQLCGASINHALNHFLTPHSDNHSISINTTSFDVFCYECNKEVDGSSHKKLLECVDLIKREVKKPTPTVIINNIEDKIAVTLNTMRPLLSSDTLLLNMNNSTTTTTTTSNCNTTTIQTNEQQIIKKVQPIECLPRVRGLTNLGNTCFFNAVLQCLAQTPYLLSVLKDNAETGEEFELPGGILKLNDGNEVSLPPISGTITSSGLLTNALAETLEELQSGGGVYTPRQIFSQLTLKWPQFAGGDQHDSHELLRHLLESVRSEDLRRYQSVILKCLGYNKKVDPATVQGDMKQKIKFYGQQASDRILKPDQVFRGFLVSTLMCRDCYHTSSRHEYFLDMSLPVSVEKPQPPIRRKSSPEPSTSTTSTSTLTKHQQKKEKEKEKKAKRQQKSQKKRESSDLLINENKSTSSTSSSCEESDADVEDNLTDDLPKKSVVETSPPFNRNALTLDSNGNNNNDTLKSPLNPAEKRDDTPENPNKDLINDDENVVFTNLPSSSSTTTSNTSSLQQTTLNCGDTTTTAAEDLSKTKTTTIKDDIELTTSSSSNVIVELGISASGCANLIKQKTQQTDTVNHHHHHHLPDELEILSLNDDDVDIKQRTNDIRRKQQRTRTISHSDWSTTIAPRYQCEDGECSVQSCLNNFTALELMTGNNKVGCDNCTSRINGKDGKTVNTNATKQFLISSPPAVLILHLKRFQVGPRCMFRKLSKPVNFPFLLDIAPFCGSKVKNLPNIKRKKKLIYSLYGIVEHSGGMHGGHYVAYVKVRPQISASDPRWSFLPKGSKAELDQTDEDKKRLEEAIAAAAAAADDSDDTPPVSEEEIDEDEGAVGGCSSSATNTTTTTTTADDAEITPPPGKWYYVSDSRVQEISEDNVKSAQAYLLFYERIY